MNIRDVIYQVIDGEREYQDQKWCSNSTSSSGVHSNLEFLVYMRDYVEEALHFCSRNGDPKANDFAKDVIRKVTALGVAAMEQNGIAPRKRGCF